MWQGKSTVLRWLIAFLAAALLIGFATTATAQSPFGQQSRFLPPDQAFQPTLAHDGNTLVIRWDIAPGYYLYRHRFSADGDGKTLKLDLPDGEIIEDDYYGRTEVFRRDLTITTRAPGADSLTLHWQGCADAGLCYPPQQRTFALENAPPGTGADTSAAKPAPSTTRLADTADTAMAEDQQLAARLADDDQFWTLAVFFGMGVLLTATPCVLPMLPILSSLIVGRRQHGENRRGAGFLLSIAFVLPMATTYAVLGVTAAMAGANLQILFQNTWFIGLFATLFVVLALAMFGVFELELPRALRQRLDAGLSRQGSGRFKGAAVMGVLSALLVGPCMTAPLAGALLFIAESGNLWLGGAALFALGLGMGAPLVLVGTVGNRLLPRPGAWMRRVRGLFGFVMLGMAIWFLDRVVPDAIILGLWGALGLGFGVSLRALVRDSESASAMTRVATACAAVIGLWSTLVLVGAAGGASDPWRPLAVYTPAQEPASGTSQSPSRQPLTFDDIGTLDGLKNRLAATAESGQMTLVEFTAEWCISCEVIEEEVFGDPTVKTALQDVQRLSIDVTDYDATDRAIMRHFGIVGPPTLLWFGPDGQERRDSRIVGELSAQAFLDRYAQARQAPPGTQEE